MCNSSVLFVCLLRCVVRTIANAFFGWFAWEETPSLHTNPNTEKHLRFACALRFRHSLSLSCTQNNTLAYRLCLVVVVVTDQVSLARNARRRPRKHSRVAGRGLRSQPHQQRTLSSVCGAPCGRGASRTSPVRPAVSGGPHAHENSPPEDRDRMQCNTHTARGCRGGVFGIVEIRDATRRSEKASERRGVCNDNETRVSCVVGFGWRLRSVAVDSTEMRGVVVVVVVFRSVLVLLFLRRTKNIRERTTKVVGLLLLLWWWFACGGALCCCSQPTLVPCAICFPPDYHRFVVFCVWPPRGALYISLSLCLCYLSRAVF